MATQAPPLAYKYYLVIVMSVVKDLDILFAVWLVFRNKDCQQQNSCQTDVFYFQFYDLFASHFEIKL